MQTCYYKMGDLMDAVNVCADFLSSVLPFVSPVVFFLCRYNKRDVDFSSLRDYNDYLEQVEDIGKRPDVEASLTDVSARGTDQAGLLPLPATHHATLPCSKDHGCILFIISYDTRTSTYILIVISLKYLDFIFFNPLCEERFRGIRKPKFICLKQSISLYLNSQAALPSLTRHLRDRCYFVPLTNRALFVLQQIKSPVVLKELVPVIHKWLLDF